MRENKGRASFPNLMNGHFSGSCKLGDSWAVVKKANFVCKWQMHTMMNKYIRICPYTLMKHFSKAIQSRSLLLSPTWGPKSSKNIHSCNTGLVGGKRMNYLWVEDEHRCLLVRVCLYGCECACARGRVLVCVCVCACALLLE